MLEAAYERLSALDAAFLQLEDPQAHMHVGGVILMDAAPLIMAHGGIDFARVRSHFEAAVHKIPRLQQRVERVPGFGHPVWLEDADFHLDYHVRHTALPQPGGMAELHRLVGHIFSQPLDRGRPLWEMWVVEGLEGRRFAVIAKIHHCLMDGMGALSLMAVLAGGQRGVSASKEPALTPTGSQLWWGEAQHRLSGLRDTMHAARKAVERARTGSQDSLDLARGLGETFRNGLSQATNTPLNPERLGPHRRFETWRTSMKDVKAIKNQLGGTINDVVLTILTSACRSYLSRRGVNPDEITRFRALVPANMRTGQNQGLGNRIAFMLPTLPVAESCPLLQHGQVRREMRRHKEESSELASTDFLEQLDDGLGLGLVAAGFKVAVARRAFSLVASNVPGPPVALSMFGAKVLGVYPLVPLFTHQALGVAMFSYDGTLYWGLQADWHAIQDLDAFVSDLDDAFQRLKESAQIKPGVAEWASPQ